MVVSMSVIVVQYGLWQKQFHIWKECMSFKYYSTEQQAENYTRFTDTCPDVILYADVSIVTIKQSLFTGNHWRILYGKCGSNISISSSTFASNEAYHGGSAISLNTCTSEKCKGDILKAVDAFIIITHSFSSTL